MEHREIMERASNLSCMLKCLCAVDSDNIDAVQVMPQALQITTEYAESLFEAIANEE
jgi:hypothetical protein